MTTPPSSPRAITQSMSKKTSLMVTFCCDSRSLTLMSHPTEPRLLGKLSIIILAWLHCTLAHTHKMMLHSYIYKYINYSIWSQHNDVAVCWTDCVKFLMLFKYNFYKSFYIVNFKELALNIYFALNCAVSWELGK